MGYRGRTALSELLIVDKSLRDLILQHASQDVLEEQARKSGFRTMRERAEDLIKARVTTRTEVARVTA
jgi:type II secretory ATPase GspE/PulE/Tfp pilus assembly ATPase PilB-like protein